MKTTLLIAVLLAAPVAAAADDVDKASVCESRARAARSLMEARQAGVPGDMLMEPVKQTPEHMRPAAQEMVLRALEHPRFQTRKMQDRAVEEFGNVVYLECMRQE